MNAAPGTPTAGTAGTATGSLSLTTMSIVGRILLPPRCARSTQCYAVNMGMPEITQRDLRSKSREIMDAVEHGQAFTVTRDGHQIGELIPIRRKRRFVSRQEFAAMSRNALAGDLQAFRADQDATADHEDGDPYDR
jgi:antitoxin (DNA-binding transcriptional repressor) of toxin-antitoxin stability system